MTKTKIAKKLKKTIKDIPVRWEGDYITFNKGKTQTKKQESIPNIKGKGLSNLKIRPTLVILGVGLFFIVISGTVQPPLDVFMQITAAGISLYGIISMLTNGGN